jgi:hypothetical protein
MSSETAKSIVEGFMDWLCGRAYYGIHGEKPIAVIAALKRLFDEKIAGKSLLEVLPPHSQDVKPIFVYLARRYSNIQNPSSSWDVITGPNRELQKAIETFPKVGIAFSKLTIEEIRILHEKYMSSLALGSTEELQTRTRGGLSKYEYYWKQSLQKIESLLDEACKCGRSRQIDVSGLANFGRRGHWTGSVVVSKSQSKSEMAHTRSLGNVLLRSGVLDKFGNKTFRLRVSDSLKLEVQLHEVSEVVGPRQVVDEELVGVPIVMGQMNKAENTVHRWFQELSGDIIGILDFVDKTTFGYLDSIPKCCGIRLIASNIKEPEVCKGKAEKCSRDRPYFEIVVINKIHERWIGSKACFFIGIGTDLKTDALGHCTHTISKIKPDNFRVSAEQFDGLWTKTEEQLRQMYGSNLTKRLFFTSHGS